MKYGLLIKLLNSLMRYSMQPRDEIFVKGYGFLSFAENMSENIGKIYKQIIKP